MCGRKRERDRERKARLIASSSPDKGSGRPGSGSRPTGKEAGSLTKEPPQHKEATIGDSSPIARRLLARRIFLQQIGLK